MDSQPDSRHTDCHTLKLIKYFVILHFINACTIAHSTTSTTTYCSTIQTGNKCLNKTRKLFGW